MNSATRSKFFSIFFMLVLTGCGGGGGGGGDGPIPVTGAGGSDAGGTGSGGTGSGGTGSGGTGSGGTGTGGTGTGGTGTGGTGTGGTGTGGTGTGGTGTGGTGTGGSGTGSTAQTLLPCINTATNLCSGSTIIQTEVSGVALTETGVQVYGKSTSDLVPAQTAANTTQAWGLAPERGGIAEIRLEKNAEGAVTRAGMLLSQIGISWDTVKDRPQIIEIFSPTQGRATLGASDTNRSIMFGPLPPSSNLNHYDWAVRGAAGTQENYANNVYFPRTEPIRCPGGGIPCSTTYTAPSIQAKPGNWQATSAPGIEGADEISVFRLHEDGDLRAGDDVPDANGPRWIADSDGFGVSYPGFKGFRTFTNWNYQYANLASWFTQDTVEIVEWANGANEHNKNRRGYVAYGNVTPLASIPATGTATYTGGVYGQYVTKGIATSAADDVITFRGTATVTVNFTARTASVVISNTRTYDAAFTPVPATFTATIPLDGNRPNYAQGPVANTAMSGGMGARFFGPNGPSEIGGAITMTSSNCQPSSCQTVIAGFIGKQ